MILIKDRHVTSSFVDSFITVGKYDTYKGSTREVLHP